MIIAGADPGLQGAISVIDTDAHTVEIFEMPTHTIKPGAKKKELVNPHRLSDILSGSNISRIYIEEVNAMPGEGVVSAFSFGRSFGTLIATAAAHKIPYSLVRPAVWKRLTRTPAEKDAAIYRATQLFPDCESAWRQKNQDGCAEATLIAFYGLCEMHIPILNKFTLKGFHRD